MVLSMSQSLDGPLSLKEWVEMHFHMLVCKWCRDYINQIEALRKVLESVSVAESDLLPGAIERIKRSQQVHRDEGN
jgi:predicted anti-sigma-YlaC factor YlaD